VSRRPRYGSGAGIVAAGGSTAKIRAGEATGKVAETAHQVHGAIGFTLHHPIRRLWSWRDEFGAESHRSRELGREVMAAGADALWPTITDR
jgi:acyl-CoA dehydrogenase